MKTESIAKLLVQRRKDKERIEELQASIADEVKERKARIEKIEAKLGTVINKSGDEGTFQNVTLEGMTAYASETGKYSLLKAERGQLNDWVLEPLANCVPESLDADTFQDALTSVYDRLDIFQNKVNKDPIIHFRKETGGKEVEGDLKGGKLPAGITYYLEKKVNIRKAS